MYLIDGPGWREKGEKESRAIRESRQIYELRYHRANCFTLRLTYEIRRAGLELLEGNDAEKNLL